MPEIFLDKEKSTNNFLVVDGQQRLKTIEAFKDGVFPLTGKPFILKNVKEKWLGKSYSDLDLIDKKKFNDSILRAKIIQQISPEDNNSVYHIFERLNTGGTPLQSQEIRNCIYYGNFNELLHRLNVLALWRKLY